MRVSLLVFSLTFFNLICSCFSRVTFTIGALFHEDDTDIEMAFMCAINRENLYNPETFFQTQIDHVSKTDSFTVNKRVCNMTNNQDGIVAILGPHSVISSEMTESICNYLEIPHIQANWNPNPMESANVILNFYPESDTLANGLGTIVKHLNWKNYAILYENEEAFVRLQYVIEMATKTSNPVVFRKLEENGDSRAILKQIVNTTIVEMIIDCETDHILNILEQAKELKLLDSFHSFFLTSVDAHTLDYSSLNALSNITTIRLMDPNNPTLQTFVRDWDAVARSYGKRLTLSAKDIRTDVALTYDAVNHLTQSLIELDKTEEIVSKPMNCEEDSVWEGGLRIAAYMKKRALQNTITGPVKFDQNGRRIDFMLEVVELVNGEMKKTSTWSPINPAIITNLRSNEEEEQLALENLQKQLVIVTSRIGAPYLMRRKKKYPGETLEGNAEFEGYSLDLIDAIAKELNFTYLFRITPGNGYGKYNPVTKKWDGLIADLLEHKAHLAICDLTITYQRRQVVDFSSPFMELGIAILFKEGPEEERNIFAFMLPLSFEVWLYSITAYLGVSFSLFLVARMAPGDWENPHPCDDEPEELENIWTLKNCMWLTLGSLMTQGCDILPKGISSRMSTTMWWFFCLLMTSSYTANLAAFLTMQRMGPTIDSAEALSKQTKIKYGLLEGGATEAFFRESNVTTYKRMWTQMQSFKPSVFEKNNDDGVKRVLSSKETSPYAFLMESSSIEYETASKCSLKSIGEPLDSKRYGIAMPMDAKYRSAINKVILSMQELGNLTRLKTKWWKDMVEGGACPDKVQEESSTELALANVGGVFVVLGIGVGIAFVISILEFLWNVENVAVQERITFSNALLLELKFVINVWEKKKLVKPEVSEKSSDSDKDEHSVTGSLIPLSVFDKNSNHEEKSSSNN